MNRILKAYLKRLTNLSTRNKSLLLTTLPAEQFLDINETDFLLGKSSFELIQNIIQKKTRIALCDILDPRFEKVNEVSKRLRKIARTEHFIEEERGSRDLYVGYPFIRGKLSDGTPIHAPLLFFPVTLRIDREQWCLFERNDIGITLNRSFALAYAHFNEVVISDEILEKSFEDFSKDMLEFRTQLYEWLKETPLKINFNQQLFEEKLQPFDIQKSSDLQLLEKNGELKLFPEAVLGIFPQAGSYLVPDYNALLEMSEDDNFQMLLLEKEADENWDQQEAEMIVKDSQPQIKEEQILTPFAIDESQEAIIRSVKTGQSVVVQGPPGSGKSQLICNLMADFASQGKRVLLVCQKRAALDVVYQRLKTVGMDPFVGLIHDFKNDRADLYRQFATQIEQVESYRQQNYSLDAVFLERQFTQESRQIDRTVNELDNFREALFDEKESGISVKELYLTSDPKSEYVDLKDIYRHFRLDQWDDFKRRFKIYSSYSLRFDQKHDWYKRRSFARFGLGDLRSMERMLSDWPEAYLHQSREFESVTGSPFSIDYIQNRNEILERLADIAELVQNDTIYFLFKTYLFSDKNSTERLAFIRQTSDALEGFAEDGIETTLGQHELSIFRGQLRKAIDAKQSSVSSVWWSLFGNEKAIVSEIAQKNNLTISPQDLETLDLRVRNRMELEIWLTNPLLNFDKKYLEFNASFQTQHTKFFQQAESAADAVQRASKKPWTEVIKYLASKSSTIFDFQRHIEKLLTWLKSWDTIEAMMLPYLLPEQIEKLVEEPDKYSVQLLSTLSRDFDSLAETDKIWAEMNDPEQIVSRKVLSKGDKLNYNNANDILNLFENSITLEWIEHIENKYPELRAVTSLKMQQWEEQLQGSISQKEDLSRDITTMKLRETTYKNVEKNRLGNRVTYRELNHQVTKKRKIWPIRKLLENYSDDVFSLIPCWMASPEAVSAIFPMEAGLFDLVIFDEASQCYAEYGIPAAYRGKQVVVAGDSKQLSPSDLYKVRYEERGEEDEITVALEVASLLDLAAQSLDQYQLSGHYRSLSLDLIDFSNHHFYKDSLRLLPDFNLINSQEPGISYIKTEGVWKQNTNLIEAEKVVELISELGKSGKTVGVVTFNFYQQQLIQETLEAANITAAGLFVKNIENVQGDERDIIIFSMGYAPDEKGKVSANFGSLNAAGGENRLNVAVTRAREKIYFVTSLWPSQLQTENAANQGPKLLKAYLQYAQEVSEGSYIPKPLKTDRFRSNWLLKDRLATMKPELQKELPFSDLTIKKEGVYKGLILTDDDLYHRSKSSKEPHAYLPLLLRLKNWPARRIYSREYWAGSMNLD
ncbi:AAA domain-containing protein [Dyadobacter sp. CY345]|uniref:AAA domain-containing protein n=1 Tax=Dyadobacter sp. CY345 TaxID=2909335 RepID=UPI001F2CBA76|nr:AAA domain-containing protein [Dyadobacter sp. CY345]MCF2444403.1 AAA domain-containing protein [Dyadobacter sp. CY345]